MTKWIILALTIAVAMSPLVSRAHDSRHGDSHHGHDHDHHGSNHSGLGLRGLAQSKNWTAYRDAEVEVEGEIDPDELTRELVDEIHEISHDHTERKTISTFIRKWGKNFNLLKAGTDLLRWVDYRIHRQPALSEHAKNLGLIFGLSHVIEASSGPVGAAVGFQAGLPDAVNWTILAIGGVISIPGLDPVCVGLAAAYKGSDRFRAKITKIRIVMARASQATVNGLRLPQLVSKFGAWKPGSQRAMDILLAHAELSDPLISGGTVTFASDGGAFYLARVTIHDRPRFQGLWESLKDEIDRNTWAAVNELIRLKEDQEPPFYVESLNGPNEYQLLPGAIQPWGKWQWCRALLEKS